MISLDNATGGNLVFSKAGLTGLSGAATTFSTAAAAIQFANAGKMLSKAQVSGGATPTTDAVSGVANTLVANQAVCYAWCLDAAGTVKIVAGKVVAYTDTTAGSTKVELPLVPSTLTPFSYSVVKAGSTTVGTWTLGTSNWNATGIVVDTPVDLFSWPSTPPLTA